MLSDGHGIKFMANIYIKSMHLYKTFQRHHAPQDYKTIIKDGNGNELCINEDGTMLLTGCVKQIALALVKYVVQKEFTPGMIGFTLNHVLRIAYEDDTFTLQYLVPDKPEFFDELCRHFNRIVNMKVFW